MKGKIIEIKPDKSIDLSILRITISEGISWKTTLIPIFTNGIIDETNYPQKAGIYNLHIQYYNLYSNEIMLYPMDPKLEKIKFQFYTENERFFCKINSLLAYNLNKEIVLNQLTEELKETLKHL